MVVCGNLYVVMAGQQKMKHYILPKSQGISGKPAVRHDYKNANTYVL